MKTNQPFHSTRTHWAAALLVATAAVALTVNSQAAKPPQNGPQNGSLEVLVTGDLPSAPDHTGDDVDGDGVYDYDICRAKDFLGGGRDKLGLRKLWLDVSVISAVAPLCVKPGVAPFGTAEIWFPATTGDDVDATYHFDSTRADGTIVRYHLALIGTITAGQWPPADGTTLEITFTTWTGLYPAAKSNNACKVTPASPVAFANPVVFTVTRNDAAHTDDECDCPFDYPVDLVCP